MCIITVSFSYGFVSSDVTFVILYTYILLFVYVFIFICLYIHTCLGFRVGLLISKIDDVICRTQIPSSRKGTCTGFL